MFSPLRLPQLCLLLLGAGVALLVAGCGPSRPKTYPVSGTVTLDGKPIAEAGVMLMPKSNGRPATGTTDADGKFTVMTFEPGDGALEGDYFITVTKKEGTGVQADPDGLSGEIAPGGIKEVWIVPKKYGDPKTSDLTVEVASGMAPLELKLTSK